MLERARDETRVKAYSPRGEKFKASLVAKYNAPSKWSGCDDGPPASSPSKKWKTDKMAPSGVRKRLFSGSGSYGSKRAKLFKSKEFIDTSDDDETDDIEAERKRKKTRRSAESTDAVAECTITTNDTAATAVNTAIGPAEDVATESALSASASPLPLPELAKSRFDTTQRLTPG